MKTENQADVGRHAFEVAGLGLAPFRFVGASQNIITYPDGTTKAGGSCAYCGTGIVTECHVRSSDGKTFKVGCNCIEKVGDAGLLKAYKSSPEWRKHQNELRRAKDQRVIAELDAMLKAHEAELSATPHRYGFKDRETGRSLTEFDDYKWHIGRCGASGRVATLRGLKKRFPDFRMEVAL